jgi:hypothetical protein
MTNQQEIQNKTKMLFFIKKILDVQFPHTLPLFQVPNQSLFYFPHTPTIAFFHFVNIQASIAMTTLQICDKKHSIKVVASLPYPTNLVAKPNVVCTTH